MQANFGNKKLTLLAKVAIFLGILFCLDFIFGTGLKFLYNNQKSGWLYRATYSFDSTKADILIFGASRANHHYAPNIFQNRMNLSCYNTGRDGQIIFYNYAVLKSVLKRYSPKIVILDFSREEFRIEQESYDRLSELLPYYKSHPEIRSIIELKGPFEKLKMISKIYPYNSLLFTVAIGATDFNKNRDHIEDENGYVPNTQILNEPLTVDSTFKKYDLDPIKIKMYENFISDCTNSNIKVYVFLSPLFIKYYHDDPSVKIAQEIAKRYGVPLYDHSNDTMFLNHANLFDDRYHLNNTGARIFSNKVVENIVKEEQKKTNADGFIKKELN